MELDEQPVKRRFMVVNGKIALNPYETDIAWMDLVSVGDMIVANSHGAQFNLT